MAIIQGNAHKSSVSGFYPQDINGSLRFNDDDSAYLSWTPASAGDRKTWTWSGWVKRGNLGGIQYIFYAHSGNSDSGNFQFRFESANTILIRLYSNTNVFTTPNVFRDTSSWYHLVLAVDTTQASADDRIKLYVNGSQITKASGSAPSQNSDLAVNDSSALHTIGTSALSVGSSPFDGYLAEVNFIDGQALTADDFGELKNGVWVAKEVDVTYGTNGFHLTFQDDTEVEAFNTITWLGDDNPNKEITGFGFQSDLVWIKRRNGATNGSDHMLLDSVRGVGSFNALSSNGTQAEGLTEAGSSWANFGDIAEFTSDGFTVQKGSDPSHTLEGINQSGGTYVAWGWKAGGAPTVDNSAGAGNVPTAGSVKIDGVNSTSALAGSIPATRISANDTYGFSIVSYTGTGSAATVGHGLSSAPKFIIVKNRDATTNWSVYHSDLTSGYNLNLDTNNAQLDPSFGIVDVESGVTDKFRVEGGTRVGASADYIAYCWADTSGNPEGQRYSKFGSYAGNATSVDLGFNPAFILIKRITGTGKSWWVFDNTREVDGQFGDYLLPDLLAGQNTVATAISVSGNTITFPNNWDSSHDGSASSTYIYAAFADTREAAFWLDQSGNDNDWQPVNLDHNDTVADSPTDNYATLNPLVAGNVTLSDGNLKYQHTGSWTTTEAYSTIAIPEGSKFYFEVFQNSVGGAGTYCGVGITSNTTTSTTPYNGVGGWVYLNTGAINHDSTTLSTESSYTTGDTIGVAVDRENGTVKFYKNNTLEYTVSDSDISTGDLFFTVFAYTGTMTTNFGQQPFKYDPPA